MLLIKVRVLIKQHQLQKNQPKMFCALKGPISLLGSKRNQKQREKMTEKHYFDAASWTMLCELKPP